MNSNITGLQVKPVSGWEQRVEQLCKPEYFSDRLEPTLHLLSRLSDDEWKRLEPKLVLVRQAAKIMAAGMLKGTLKYSTDDYTIETWMAHLIGEGADQLNYQLLLVDAYDNKV